MPHQNRHAYIVNSHPQIHMYVTPCLIPMGQFMLRIAAPTPDTGLWSSQNPVDFKTRFLTILRWLDICATHTKCNTGTRFEKLKPARLVEISTTKARVHLRIISRARIRNQQALYTVLSHCWGGMVPHCRTTRKTLKRSQSSINYSSLPQTFKDAVDLTRILGLRFL
jgi:hypothetical protein